MSFSLEFRYDFLLLIISTNYTCHITNTLVIVCIVVSIGYISNWLFYNVITGFRQFMRLELHEASENCWCVNKRKINVNGQETGSSFNLYCSKSSLYEKTKSLLKFSRKCACSNSVSYRKLSLRILKLIIVPTEPRTYENSPETDCMIPRQLHRTLSIIDTIISAIHIGFYFGI